MKLVLTLCLTVVAIIFVPLALLGSLSLLIAAGGALFGGGLWNGMPLPERLGGFVFSLFLLLWLLSAPIGFYGLFRAITTEQSLITPEKRRERRWVCQCIVVGIVGALAFLCFSYSSVPYLFSKKNWLWFLLLIPLVSGAIYLVRLVRCSWSTIGRSSEAPK